MCTTSASLTHAHTRTHTHTHAPTHTHTHTLCRHAISGNLVLELLEDVADVFYVAERLAAVLALHDTGPLHNQVSHQLLHQLHIHLVAVDRQDFPDALLCQLFPRPQDRPYAQGGRSTLFL